MLPPTEKTLETLTPSEDAGRWHVVLIGKESSAVADCALPERGELSIGRVTSSDLCLHDRSVSRQHAVVRVAPVWSMTIEDLGSANGTRVRGRRLTPGERVPFEVGDLVEIGSATLIIQLRPPQRQRRRVLDHASFERRLGEECARAAKQGGHFTLLRVRTAARLVEGDEQRLIAALRASDLVGLYAPAQYEILLGGVDTDGAAPIFAEIERQLGEALAVKVGYATFPRDGWNQEQLLARATPGAAGDHSEPLLSSPAVAVGPMAELMSLVERIAAGTISVLILGETGVGKEVMAATVHRLSPRAAKPFVALNCAALSETLLESELFGHEKGSFTGAAQTKPGLIETADGGTLFLDEVGELPLSTQIKLLRVIEERQVLRVGALKPRPVDLRFVAATNRDLQEAIAANTFRADLYYRLDGATLHVPPLRERRSEVEPLARRFAAAAAASAFPNLPPPEISEQALRLLRDYAWPGNIRELRNVIERAVLLASGGRIRSEHLPRERMRVAAPGPSPGAPTPLAVPAIVSPVAVAAGAIAVEVNPPAEETINEGRSSAGAVREEMSALERRRILEALERCGGNQTRAAELLGMPRRTLLKRLDAYGVTRPRK